MSSVHAVFSTGNSRRVATRDPLPVQADPKDSEDTAGPSFEPTEINIDVKSSAVDELSRYERDFVERHEKDLNITFAAAVLFSIVGAALAIGTRPELESGPDSQTVALLNMVLRALNHSAAPVVPLAREAPPSEIADAITFFYESSLASVLATIFAMLAKGCLRSSSPQAGSLAISRRVDRQRKLDVLKSWQFNLLLRTPQVLLQTALLFLILGFWQRLSHAIPSTKYAFVLLSMPGLIGYLGTVVNHA